MFGTPKNNDLRTKAKESRVGHWQIAAAMGITEFSFSRKLREELPDEEKRMIFEIIDRIAEGGGKC